MNSNRRAISDMELIVCIGFALFSLASLLTIWGGLPLTELAGLPLLQLLTWWSLPLLMSMALTLYGSALIASPLLQADLHVPAPVLTVAAGSAMLGGYAILAIVPGQGDIMIASASGVLIGAGIAVMLLLWELVFGGLSLGSVGKLVLTALILNCLLSLVSSFVDSLVMEVAYIVTTFTATAILCVAQVRTGGSFSSGTFGDRTFHNGTLPHATLPGKAFHNLFCVASIVFAVGITRTLALRSSIDAPHVVGTTGTVAAIIAALFLLAVMYGPLKSLRLFTGFNLTTLFRILFPIVATALLCYTIFGSALQLPVTALMYAVFSISYMLMMPSCVETARNDNLPLATVFGVFAGTVYLVFTLATFIGTVLFEQADFDATTPVVAALLVLYVLSMTHAALQRRSHRRGGDTEGTLQFDTAGAAYGTDAPPASETTVPFSPYEANIEHQKGFNLADPIDLKCSVVSKTFKLSPRETDVLIAFAHGRNVEYVADQLCLSHNTIRTHSKTLYSKLGVHKKQELIDLVDGIILQ